MLLLKLFLSFIKVGLFSVGGGYAAIPLIQNQIVEVRKLLSLEEFTDLITIAEMTPGPISINSATFVGIRLSGIWGAIVCTIGCIIPAFIILRVGLELISYNDMAIWKVVKRNVAYIVIGVLFLVLHLCMIFFRVRIDSLGYAGIDKSFGIKDYIWKIM